MNGFTEFLTFLSPALAPNPEPARKERRLKHLPGRHNQQRHAWRYGSVDAARRSMRGQSSPDERAEYRRRAGLDPDVPYEKKVTAMLAQAEKSWDRQPYETALFLDSKGNTVLRKDGNTDSVSFTDEEIDAMLKHGNIMATHNHPSGWVFPESHVMHMGSGFSCEDIGMAMTANLKAFRAVTPSHIYSMRRPKNGWPPLQEAYGRLQEMDRQLYMEIWGKIMHGQMTYEEANVVHFHTLMQRWAKEYGAVYTRRKRK